MSYNAQSMKTILTQHEIYGLVAADLIRVEDELSSYTRSSIEPISEIGRYLIESGGKRVRPALLLLTARMLGETSDATIRLAAVMEFIHNATLVHDDVIDESDTRRGRPSANANWGNAMTVLAGDWLYMESFAVALEERNFEVLNTLIGITQKMVEGELLQLTLVGQRDVSQEQLLDIARRKTAHLFSGCMRLPSIVAGCEQASVDKFTRIGMNLGMSFQLVDDVLDLTSTKEAMGKPVANDLKEGNVTMPVYFALEQGGADDLRKVGLVLKERAFQSVGSQDILDMVERADGVKRTRALAADYARQAITDLESFPPTPYRDAIISIPDFIINRQS
jgi:octaprenyl-diphosphate synthase